MVHVTSVGAKTRLSTKHLSSLSIVCSCINNLNTMTADSCFTGYDMNSSAKSYKASSVFVPNRFIPTISHLFTIN
jgi:hypothetical protein